MRESVLNIVYLAGYIIAFTGLAYQIVRIFQTKKINGLTMPYLVSLLIAKGAALPRTITSTYWVWWVQEGLATILTVSYVVAVLIHRNKQYKGEQ